MILAIIVFIFILGFLVFIHELGHFIVAKKSGIKIEEFGIGFPPRIWGKKKGETIYSINAIPIGGFVKLYGEDKVDEKYLANPLSFTAKPLWIRSLVISAGVVMNFLVAVIIFYFLLANSGFTNQQYLLFDYKFPFGEQQNFPFISLIAENSPAEKAGLKPNSIIINGNGIRFGSSKQFVQFINENKGEEVFLEVKSLSTKEVKKVNVVPRIDSPEGQGALGVGLGDIAEIRYETIVEKTAVGFLHALDLTHYSIVSLGHLIKISFEQRTIKPLSSSVAGPVGILAITKITLKGGIIAILNLMALISLALAMVNILPFPALDGGRLALMGFEGLTKKKISLKIERNINLIGFVLLIMLLILVTYKDIVQFKDVLF